ncbi:VOC family protein [Streptomyces scopuliridis]|uniref:VOC family protein n=1 Tax=Streptomyces scopuliridis TaxID=452529 RepID=A0ACD4ZGF2_9ACTN|nr:VOC family protein [Streptomyces scopuliridis]WSB97083.1 VOC family protein [Streptomyces scopuliridis]WSC09213.1 VOC family protein [Streptomyces scopuliridis]
MPYIALATLVVDDYDKALAFYTRALGFELIEDTERGDGSRWVVVRPRAVCGDPDGSGGSANSVGLLLARAKDDAERASIGVQTGGRVGFFLHTEDFARDHARMRAAGVRFLEEPRHEPYGSVAVFEDLYGNRWDLIQPA